MIHPLSSGNEIEFYVNVSKSKLLFIFDAFFSKVASINCPTLQKVIYAGAAEYLSLPMCVAFKLTKGRKINKPQPIDSFSFKIESWTDFLRQYNKITIKNDFKAQNMKPTDTAVILYSGGTTGLQKGIMLSHLNFNALATQTAANGTDSIHP